MNMKTGNKIIFADMERCIACKTCEVQCAVAHSKTKSLLTAIFEQMTPRSRIYVEAAGKNSLPVQCRQCDDAPCLNVCPSGSISRNPNGSMTFDGMTCIGCFMCAMVCPFGAITSEKHTKTAITCDLCKELDQPSCVKACPTKALIYDTVDNISKEKRIKLINLMLQ
jgi:carbon-monoxide dehydrogenase iron sulfur subunit